ncbi:DUF3820 family protein [Croceimicrobium sp.]|uniref:DUF3820 family protein n=1 Tax=Croceimicrobium sp. TaxID=2828340 RepID=UPI003BACF430
MNNQALGDPKVLIDIVRTEMPFGKYQGRKLCDVPTYYLEWFYAQGWPKGRIGVLLETLFVIRTEGLHEILDELKRRYGQDH